MGIYKQGLNRKQQLMFLPSLDELVNENNMARAIDKLFITPLKNNPKYLIILNGKDRRKKTNPKRDFRETEDRCKAERKKYLQ